MCFVSLTVYTSRRKHVFNIEVTFSSLNGTEFMYPRILWVLGYLCISSSVLVQNSRKIWIRALIKKTLQFSERSKLLIHISKTIFHKDEKDTKKIGIGQPK